MATRSSSTPSAQSANKASPRRTSASGKRSRNRAKARQGSVLLAIWAGLTGLYGGRVFLAVLLAALVIWIEALILKNNYMFFFRTVGVEILIALFIGWVFYLLQGIRET